MSNARKLSKMSVEEYLLFEESATVKHEYVNGEIFEMTGGTAAHCLIAVNIATTLNTKLKGSGCRVYGSDLKVRIDAINSFYYPDVSIDCGAYDKSRLYTQTPVVIFEVLSPSTASTDRREKMVAYKLIPSLKAYVIVQQARKRLEIYRKDDLGDWTVQEAGAKEEFALEICPGTTISVDVEDIYADAEIDDSPDLKVREDEEVYSW